MKMTKLANLIAATITPVLAGEGTVSLEYSYPSADAIPEGYSGLYTEVDGVFKLTGVRGLKTPDDITALQGALTKERDAHKDTKKRFAALDGQDIDEVLTKLDRIGELEAASGGSLDDAAIDKIVETRIQSRLNPVNRELQAAQTQVEELSGQVKSYQQKDQTRKIRDELSKVGRTLKVTDTAFEDMLMIGGMMFTVDESGAVVTNDATGVPGLAAQVWLTEQQKARPHWFPTSQGANAQGGKGGGGQNNPFTADNWNLTEQGKMVREDPQLAAQMAKQAGTTVGGRKPTK